MARLTLRDDGYAFKKIMQGRKWIGRVCKMGDGSGYLGIIGQHEYKARSEREAFEEVGARYLGKASAAALHSENKTRRQVRRVMRQAGDHVATEMLRGNYKPFDKVMKQPAPVAEALMSATFRGVARKLLK
jgi:hypothetical protein